MTNHLNNLLLLTVDRLEIYNQIKIQIFNVVIKSKEKITDIIYMSQ